MHADETPLPREQERLLVHVAAHLAGHAGHAGPGGLKLNHGEPVATITSHMPESGRERRNVAEPNGADHDVARIPSGSGAHCRMRLITIHPHPPRRRISPNAGYLPVKALRQGLADRISSRSRALSPVTAYSARSR